MASQPRRQRRAPRCGSTRRRVLEAAGRDAAQINAVMSDAAASDDSDLRTIVHCRTPLAATALAPPSITAAVGGDVLTAIVVGYETAPGG